MNEAAGRAELAGRKDLRVATRLAFGAWRKNLAYGALVALLVAAVLGPAVSWLLVKGLQVAAGGTVLNYDIADFVLSPAGVLMFLLWATLVAAVAVVSLGGHAYVAAAEAVGRDAPFLRVVGRVVADLPRVPGFGAIKLAVLSALLTPVVAASVALAGGLLLAPFQGEGLLERLPHGPLLWLLLVAGAVLLSLGFWLYVRWSLTIPVFCLEQRSLREATRASRDRTKGVFWAVARGHLLHHATWGLLVAAVSLGLGGILRPPIRSAFGAESAAAPWIVAAALALVTLVLGALAVLGVARLVALTVVHHEKLGGTVDQATFAARRAPPTGTERRRFLGFAALLLALLGVGTALTLPRVEEELDRVTSPPTVTAHRGSSLEAPQNTLAAVRLAIEDGADACEFDVHQAADGALIVFHDTNLKRLAGIDRNVYDLTGAELTRIDVGSHGGFAGDYAGETIPTLEDVLDVAKGRILLNVELKVHGRESETYAADVVNMLREKEMFEEAYISSLDLGILRDVRRLAPTLRIGAIITAKVGSASVLDCDFYSTQPSIASVSFIRRAHGQGREVHVWTINEAKDMITFADRGADSIITDVPRLAKDVYAERTPQDELRAAIRRLFD